MWTWLSEELHTNTPCSHTARVSTVDLNERIVHPYHQGETMRMVAETFEVTLGFVHCVVDPR